MNVPTTSIPNLLSPQEVTVATDTRELLAHAKRDARKRGFQDWLICDIDAHHVETVSWKEVIEPVDAEQRTRMLAFDENEIHIACPWHGYEFSLKTGRHPGSSMHRLRPAKLEIVDGEVHVLL